MHPLKYILVGLANGANFRDRASRSEAWWFVAFVGAGAAYAAYLDIFSWGGMYADYSVSPPVIERLYGGNLAATIWAFLIFGPSLAMASRRLRDAGEPTRWLTAPALLGVVLLVLAFLDPLGVERGRP